MKYTTENEFDSFDFQESYVKDIEPGNGYFHIWLDNVKILPENSCNRDIRTMRTNNLLLAVSDTKIDSVVLEGVKIYHADGKLAKVRPDEEIAPEKYAKLWKAFLGGCIYSVSKDSKERRSENAYTFILDTNEDETYEIKLTGSVDRESWDLFLNLGE